MSQTVERPWGTFHVLHEAPGLKIKRIEVRAAQRLSLQRHAHRDEFWYVLSGYGTVTVGTNSSPLAPGVQVTIARGQWHRVSAAREGMLVLLEVQTGTCDEDDIERAADDYGRA